MIRRLVLALLPLAGFALGVAFTGLGGWPAAAAALGCVALAVAAAALAAPPGADRPPAPRAAAGRAAIPRSTRRAASREDLPTVSGYWRAHDEPDWPEGEVRRERHREEEPVASER